MDSLFISLLPYILGAALAPVQIIIVILLLSSPSQGLLKASAYVAGMTLLRLLQGLVFGLLFAGDTAAGADEGSTDLVVSTLLTVLGILLLISAYRKWIKQEDSDDPPPKWLAALDSLTPLKTFGLGFGMLLVAAKLWVFTLGAIGVIAQAELGLSTGSLAYLVYIVLAQSLLLLALLTRLLLPVRSKTLLASVSAWLGRNNRPIMVGASLVFGLFFLWNGLSGLLG